MSISSRKSNEDDDFFNPDENKKKYVKIWRIESSREFLLLMLVLIFAIATSMYNPLVLQDIGKQNQEINRQNLNNTDRIIGYLEGLDANDTQAAMELMKVLLLYNQDHERDLAKLLKAHNIQNLHYVDINGTHVITETGLVELPFAINLSGFAPLNETIQTRIQLEEELGITRNNT